MRCDEMNMLILSHLDGTLSEHDEAVLAEHISDCAACARELSAQRRLSGALREFGLSEIQAPAEFSATVMAKLRAQNRRPAAWMPAAWRRNIAAAAAVLIIAGSSAGVATGFKIADLGKMIGLAGNNPPASVEAPGRLEGTATTTGGESPPAISIAQKPDDAGAQDARQENPSGSAGEGGLTEPNAGDNNTNTTGETSAAPPIEGPQVLLSSSLKVTSTLLKVAVDDLNEARIRAVSLAAGAGAATQVFQEQDDGKKIVVLRLTVAFDNAAELTAGLNKLGAVVDRQDENRDITSLYNETLVQYSDLMSRKNLAKDSAERRQVEAQAASYKQQLDAWNAETGKRVITLWLESR